MTNTQNLVVAVLLATSSLATAETLKKRGPIVCKGNDRVVIENALIEADGDGFAVSTMSNCRLTIRNSKVTAKAFAIQTAGSSIVDLESSTVVATQGAFMAAGSSMVNIKGSELVGETALAVEGSSMLSLANTVLRGGKRVGSSALFTDQGGNTQKKK